MLRRLLGKHPRHAHGRRSDGTYFTVWVCAHGHTAIGDPQHCPGVCMTCAFGDAGGGSRKSPNPHPWRRATRTEAWSFIHGVAGVHAMRGTAFEVLP